VAKRIGSRYQPGVESDLWLKQRFNREDKFFIGGYIPGTKGIGELLIGEYREDGKLYHIKRLNRGPQSIQPGRDIQGRARPQKQEGALREPARKEISTPTRSNGRSDGPGAMAQARASSRN
jgi:hypothetical protein